MTWQPAMPSCSVGSTRSRSTPTRAQESNLPTSGADIERGGRSPGAVHEARERACARAGTTPTNLGRPNHDPRPRGDPDKNRRSGRPSRCRARHWQGGRARHRGEKEPRDSAPAPRLAAERAGSPSSPPAARPVTLDITLSPALVALPLIPVRRTRRSRAGLPAKQRYLTTHGSFCDSSRRSAAPNRATRCRSVTALRLPGSCRLASASRSIGGQPSGCAGLLAPR